MTQSISNIVIVGGGSAGWLTAGVLASQLRGDKKVPVNVTLMESPDVKTIGVGEGTWPTMRTTLKTIGLSEAGFLKHCSASFKQGTKFVAWTTGDDKESYYHPFSAPAGYGELNLAAYWQAQKDRVSFTHAVTPQGYLCDRRLAPKQLATPEYAFVANYGYHLDAGKFAGLLKAHCTGKLGVKHIQGHVTRVNGSPGGDIRSLSLEDDSEVVGDLFIDCTGLHSLLIDKHYGIPFVSRSDALFNDRALAVQVPYSSPGSPIASQTTSTARPAGWIWDIGLQSRRGIGYTYSSAHTDDDTAHRVLEDYVRDTSEAAPASFEPRRIAFEPGHRESFWHRNCVAVGMSAGFLEPLEASALVMIELAAQFISDEFPANRENMDIVSKRYNRLFRYRWDRIIDFLKLHYILSKRDDTAYWVENRDADGIPDSLKERMLLWRHRAPWLNDFPYQDEIFSAASYQYVLYGMGYETRIAKNARYMARQGAAERFFVENNKTANRVIAGLPTNRDLLNAISGKT